MRIFMLIYRDIKTDRVKPFTKWWCEVRDHLHRIRVFPTFMDKTQSEVLGRQIERLVSCRIAGKEPTPELMRWLEGIPHKLRDHLRKIGLIDSKWAAGVVREYEGRKVRRQESRKMDKHDYGKERELR